MASTGTYRQCSGASPARTVPQLVPRDTSSERSRAPPSDAPVTRRRDQRDYGDFTSHWPPTGIARSDALGLRGWCLVCRVSASVNLEEASAPCSNAVTCGFAGGQGRGRTADLPIFSRTLVPTELPGRDTGAGARWLPLSMSDPDGTRTRDLRRDRAAR